MWRIILFGVAFGTCLIGQMEMLRKLVGKFMENMLISITNVILIVALSANALAVFGKYSLRNVSVLLLATGLIFCIFFRDYECKINFCKEIGKSRLKPVFVFVFCAICFFLIYSIFTIIPFGIGRDPSVYFYEGIHIAQSGGIHFSGDRFIAQNYEELKDIIEVSGAGMYSAYEYGVSDVPGDIIIQFLHMFPCLLAIGYDLAGVWGMQLVNPIMAIFCAVLVFLNMKKISDNERTAWIAFFLCALNPAQIYSARITQSELLCQLIYMLGIYYFGIAWKQKKMWVFALSGVLAGLMTFNRIDMYILGIGIFMLALYHIWIKPENMKAILVYSFSYTIVGCLALIYGCTFSYPYYKDHWDMGVLFAILLCNAILFIIVFISAIIQKKNVIKKRFIDPIAFFAEKKNAMFFFISLLVGLVLYTYFLRPIIASVGGDISEELRFRSNALVEFCFYTSFLAILFAIYGIFKLIWNVSVEKIYSYLPWAFMGMSNFLVYMYNPSIASDHIWASRRWVTICIPFVLMLTAVGISSLNVKRITLFVQIAICTGFVAFFMFQGRGFLFVDIGGQIWEEYDQYAQILDKDEIYFADNKMLVTILQKIWGKSNVYRINEEFQNNIETYLESKNEPVYYIGDISSGVKNNSNLAVRKVADYTLYSSELERAYGRMPEHISTVTIPADIYRVEYVGKNKIDGSVYMRDKSSPERFEMTQFGGENRSEKKKGIVSNGNAGYVLYGPYDELENGTYEVRASFTVLEERSAEQDAVAFFEVVGRDQKVINRKTIYSGNDGQISVIFSINDRMDSIEYRFYTYEGVIVEVEKVELLQLSDLFIPGLDEWNSVAKIMDQLLIEELDWSQVAYYYGSSSDGILFDGLTDKIADEITFMNFCSLNEINKYDILVARLEDMNWFSLLEKYSLAFREGDYLVFAKKNTVELKEKNVILSRDDYINMEALVTQLNGRYFVGEYKSLPAGEYEFRIELPEKLTVESANVYIYQNNGILAQSELLKGENATTVSVNTDNNLTNLHVEVIDHYNVAMENVLLWVKQNNTASEMFYKKYLQPITDRLKEAVGNKKLILWDSNNSRVETIEECSAILYNQITIMDEVGFTENEIDKYDFIISEKRAYNEILLLKAGYTVVCDTPLYALFVSENTKDYFNAECFLSDGEYLMTKYYQNITDKKLEGLSLRKGSYEFDVHISLPSGYDSHILEGSKVWFENDGEMEGDAVFINDIAKNKNQHEFDIYVPLYFDHNVNNLNVNMEVGVPVGITCEIRKIKCKSIGQWIDLKEFEYLSGNLNQEGIYSCSRDQNTIYGPYYELEAGMYTVQLIYETDDISHIVFDIAANGGEVLADMSAEMSINSNGEYIIELSFEVKESDKLLEFRTHIPAGREFLLKEVYIFSE